MIQLFSTNDSIDPWASSSGVFALGHAEAVLSVEAKQMQENKLRAPSGGSLNVTSDNVG